MENKEIYIDGVNVAECPRRKKEVTFMNVIKCYNYGACEGVNCLYKQLKAKEQECEKLKEDLIEAKAHGDYLNNLALSETLNLVSEQLDQLKAENEILEKDKANLAVITETLKVQFKQLKQTLEEIKSLCYEQDLNEDFFACEVLQKIKECEVDK